MKVSLVASLPAALFLLLCRAKFRAEEATAERQMRHEVMPPQTCQRDCTKIHCL